MTIYAENIERLCKIFTCQEKSYALADRQRSHSPRSPASLKSITTVRLITFILPDDLNIGALDAM